MDGVLCSHYVQREAGRSEGFVCLIYEVPYCSVLLAKNALGAVCSLLCPGCDSGFDRDEVNANLTSEAHELVSHFAVCVFVNTEEGFSLLYLIYIYIVWSVI